MSPTQRSLRELRTRFYQAKAVERWNAHARIRQDLWGGDIIACRRIPRPEIVLVQTTTKHNLAARERKCRDNPDVMGWIRSGGRFLLHGWDGKVLEEREITVAADDPLL